MAPSDKGTESGLLFGSFVGWQAEPAHELRRKSGVVPTLPSSLSK